MRKSMVEQMTEQANLPEGLSPADRMRDLTRRLIAVPKAEIDELAAAEKKAKKRRAEAP